MGSYGAGRNCSLYPALLSHCNCNLIHIGPRQVICPGLQNFLPYGLQDFLPYEIPAALWNGIAVPRARLAPDPRTAARHCRSTAA